MPYYRLYFLDPHSGHINRFEEYDAIDDVKAIRLAERRVGDGPLELWSGRRKIGCFVASVTLAEPPRPRRRIAELEA